MTIDTTTSSVTYLGNGSTTVFTFPFVADQASDLKVYYTDASGNQTQLGSTLYSVVINSPPTGGLWGIGGSVTYPLTGSPIATGTSLSIVRDVPYTQDVSISNQGAFYPQAVEQGLDILEMQIQQIETGIGRAITVPVADPAPQTVLPMPAQRALNVFGWDGTGENIQMYPTTSQTVGPIAFLSQTVTHAMSPYTVTNANLLFVNASSGSVTIILPDASPVNQIFVSRVDNGYSVGDVIIQAQGGQTILGASTYTGIQWQYQSNVFISDGVSNWDITSQFRPISATGTTNSYVSFINIFDVINNPFIINDIQTRGAGSRVDSAVAAAIALGGEIYFPAGDYHLENTITMAPGVIFRGAGQGNTQIYTGEGPTSTWGIELLLPNGTESIEAPKFYDMTIQVTGSGNGIRWNSITGGFTNDNTSQQYMSKPRLINVVMGADTPTPGIGIQLNKSFDYMIEGCQFEGFNVAMNFEGSDIGSVRANRTDATVTWEIVANSHGTFGASLYISENDFNNPSAASALGGFVASTYQDITIENNHMELDGGVTRNNLLAFSGNSFEIKVHNNRVDSNGNCTNWLNITSDVNRYLVSVFNNTTATASSLQGTVVFDAQPYFNNSGGRCIVRHGGNTSGDNTFPMNSDQFFGQATPYAAVVSCNTAGVDYSGSTINPSCNDGVFQLPYDANAGHWMQISDWTSYGAPGNQLIGTLTIIVATAAGANNLVGSWQILDGTSSVATGTITHAVANQWYYTTLISSHAFTTNAVVRYWNNDGTRNERFYIGTTSFGIG